MKDVTIISKVVGRKEGGDRPVTGGGSQTAVDLSAYLLKKTWDTAWELREKDGVPYLFGKLPVVLQSGMTSYVADEAVDLPGIYDGLPIDNQTLKWVEVTDESGAVSRVLVAAGGGTGGGGGSVEFPLKWKGFREGSWDGSEAKTIEIPSKLSELENDGKFFTDGGWIGSDANSVTFGSYLYGGVAANTPSSSGQLLAFNNGDLSSWNRGSQFFIDGEKLYYRQYWDNYWRNWRRVISENADGVIDYDLTLGGNLTINGEEDNEIKTVYNPNFSIGNLEELGWKTAIRHALRFRWHDDAYEIGTIRGASSNSVGFGVTYQNNQLVWRVNKEQMDVFGNLNVGGSLNMPSGYSQIQCGEKDLLECYSGTETYLHGENSLYLVAKGLYTLQDGKAYGILHEGNYRNYEYTAKNLSVTDIRNTTPKPSDVETFAVTAQFANADNPGDGWYSGLSIQGWTNDYKAWQLRSGAWGFASDHLYFRNGVLETWNDWRRVITGDVDGVLDSNLEIKGEEGGNIKFVINTDRSIGNGMYELASIRHALRFPWYDDAYEIGTVRSNTADAWGFGVTYQNNQLVWRVDRERMDVYGDLRVKGGLIRYNETEGYFYIDGNLVVSGGLTAFADEGAGNQWIMDANSLEEVVSDNPFKVYSAKVVSMIASNITNTEEVKLGVKEALDKLEIIEEGLSPITTGSSTTISVLRDTLVSIRSKLATYGSSYS